MKKENFNVSGMSCSACSSRVYKVVSKVDGVVSVNVNLLTGKMTVNFDEDKIDEVNICEAVKKAGYSAVVESSKETRSNNKGNHEVEENNTSDEVSKIKNRLIWSIVFLAIMEVVAMGPMIFPNLEISQSLMSKALTNTLIQGLILIPIVFLNRKYFINGIPSLFKGGANMDTLVAVGSGASIIYGIYVLFAMAYGFEVHQPEIVNKYSHDIYLESAAMILTLITVGKYMEAKSKKKTSQAIGTLVSMVPKEARLIAKGKITNIMVENLKVGDIILVKSGERIPVDGTIIEGYSTVDQSAITGESIPVEKQIGDKVISATMNNMGILKIRCDKIGEDSTINQIITLVEEASSSKAPIAKLADKIAGVFVPIVMFIALVTGILWFIFTKDFSISLSMGISVLVISCPCALGLATPVAIMVGTGRGAQMGVLIKSGEAFQVASEVDTVVMDKTGTITEGKPSVTNLDTISGSEEQKVHLITAIYHIEKVSEHPLANAITKFCSKELSESELLKNEALEGYENVFGKGVKAVYLGNKYIIGNKSLMEDESIVLDSENELLKKWEKYNKEGKSVMLIAVNQTLVGVIGALDLEKKSSISAIKEMKNMGLDVFMLTGDSEGTANELGKRVGVTKVISNVLPQGKNHIIEDLQAKGHKVVMIGDGINDGPALARANVGMAIGAGTDVAIESADIILMNSSLYDAVKAIKLSKAVIKNIKENLFWAFFYNVIGIPIAAGIFMYVIPIGIKLTPSFGALAMSLSSVFVVSNALRLRTVGRYEQIIGDTKGKIDRISDISEVIEMKYELKIEGMMCGHCKSHTEDALNSIEGVTEVIVDLENNMASVLANKEISVETFDKVIKEAGYNLLEYKLI